MLGSKNSFKFSFIWLLSGASFFFFEAQLVASPFCPALAWCATYHIIKWLYASFLPWMGHKKLKPLHLGRGNRRRFWQCYKNFVEKIKSKKFFVEKIVGANDVEKLSPWFGQRSLITMLAKFHNLIWYQRNVAVG